MICKCCQQEFPGKWLLDQTCNSCFATILGLHEHLFQPSNELPEPRPRGDEEDDSTHRNDRAKDINRRFER